VDILDSYPIEDEWLLLRYHNEVSCVEVIEKDKMLLLPRAAVVLQAGLLAELSLLVHFEVPDESSNSAVAPSRSVLRDAVTLASMSTSRDVVINDVALSSLKTPEWSQLVFCDVLVTILVWSLRWHHICSSVTKLVFSS
jgi:hypothetical protein